MRFFRPLAAVLILGLFAGGCSFFKRDLKSSNESADAGGGAIAQKDSTAESGPSEGVVGLEKAREDSFEWEDKKGNLSAKSAPAADLPVPPRNPEKQNTEAVGSSDVWSKPGVSTPPKEVSEQVADAMSSPTIEGPAIEPAPTGKPLSGGMSIDSPGISSQPSTSTNPITQTSPLESHAETNSSQGSDSLTLRSSSSPPSGIMGAPIGTPSFEDSSSSSGFQTITDDASQSQLSLQAKPPVSSTVEDLSRETDRQALNLARAISPTSSSGNAGSGLSNASSSATPGFQPSGSGKSIESNNGPALGETGPSSTQLPAATSPQFQAEPEGNLLAMANKGKVSSDSSPAPAAAPTSGPLPDAKTLKDQGIQQYKNKQFDQATQSFRQYLSAYPDEDQEIEWRLAQSLFLGNRWGEAEREFDKLRGSPRPEFRADAILKLGMIDQKRGNVEGAREQWRRVVADYPKTDAATRASKLLAGTP